MPASPQKKQNQQATAAEVPPGAMGSASLRPDPFKNELGGVEHHHMMVSNSMNPPLLASN